MTALIVIVALVAFSTALGLVWRARQGRIRAATGEAAEFAAIGADVTLLQFSSEVCAPCRATHTVLARIAERAGVAHVDLDITNRPDLANRFHILQTPTTLILDARGAVLARIGGAARPTTVNLELDRILLGSPA
ncbi:thioredoxin family protein [soil metagenome]